MKVNFDLEKYIKLKDNILIDNRKCADGLCCFLDKRSENIIKTKTKYDIILFFGLIKGASSDISNTISLIEKNGIKIFDSIKRCNYLNINYTKKKENHLIIKTNCSNYTFRPFTCAAYPYGQKCRLVLYHKGRVIKENYYLDQLIMYGFEADHFPELKNFSTGTIRHWSRNYFLIPIPKAI